MKYLIPILFLFCSCNSDSKQESNTVHLEHEKKTSIKKSLIFYFVDISGSFNKRQEEGKFKGQNYFELACLQIKDNFRNSSNIGEDYLIVRAIKSSSFGDDATITKLDLTDENYIFHESPPKEDIKKKRWQEKKNDFIIAANRKAEGERESSISEINAFLDSYNDKSSDYTDLINALNSVKPIIENENFNAFRKKIIVYSDFKETKSKLNSNLNIALDSVEIEGRFVSKNAFSNLVDYEKNKTLWKNTLKCKELIFRTPIESTNYE